jgi:hypothetical protein
MARLFTIEMVRLLYNLSPSDGTWSVNKLSIGHVVRFPLVRIFFLSVA